MILFPRFFASLRPPTTNAVRTPPRQLGTIRWRQIPPTKVRGRAPDDQIYVGRRVVRIPRALLMAIGSPARVLVTWDNELLTCDGSTAGRAVQLHHDRAAVELGPIADMLTRPEIGYWRAMVEGGRVVAGR